jgi:hypothetical protein
VRRDIWDGHELSKSEMNRTWFTTRCPLVARGDSLSGAGCPLSLGDEWRGVVAAVLARGSSWLWGWLWLELLLSG